MVILIHVIIAVSSISIATIGLFKPSTRLFSVSYGFILATLASGTVLLLSNPTHLLQSCISGLSYLAVVSVMTVASHLRIRRVIPENNI